MAVAGGLVVAQPAVAKQGPLSIDSVWVGDSQHAHRTVLNSNSTATYHVDVNNTTGAAMLVNVEFEVYDIDGPSGYSYYYTANSVNMPAGLSRFYSPSAIPTDATTDTYMARISIWPTNSANPSNDGDFSAAQFQIFSLSTNPVNDAIKELQNGALCVSDVLPLGQKGLLLKSVKTATETVGLFEDIQTGNLYEVAVTLAPKPVGTADECAQAIVGVGSLFRVYQMVLD